MIKHIAFTVYPSDDVAGTRAWYEEHLGLRFAGPYLEGGVEKYNEAHLGEGAFGLMASEWVGREPGTAGSIVFEVDDIEAAVAALRERGVDVGEIEQTPMCKQVWLSDPEGNQVSLHQKKPGR